MKRYNNTKQGFVLVVVLWIIFFLSVSVLTLSVKNRMNVRLSSFNNEALRVLYLAKEGVNRVIVMLAEDDSAYDAFSDAWAQRFTLETDAGVAVCEVTDEDRFFNVNTLPPEILENLKTIFPQLTAEEIESLGKAKPFNVTKEILDATGMDPQLFYGDTQNGKPGINDMFTVFSDGKLNINTASADVLRLIPEMTEAAAQTIVDHRNSAPFEKNETLSQELSLLGLTAPQVSSLVKICKVDSSAFRVVSRADSRRKAVSRTIETVLKRKAKAFSVLFAKEN
ncbi:MAG: general secretion pathway protein GspK [Candidatus Omnitrophica bacterium]|nr:general secretion pathway protein GspK [Candidatus Omnitrophota bacterium]MBU4477490.1 general secretion pathway protein GspK [Candidatus Omnitrophota bacterium]MCG2703728.1 general secretion pathway protein GspK [Candidatus Omnitrophota bacterium]